MFHLNHFPLSLSRLNMSVTQQQSQLHLIVKKMMKERNIEDYTFNIDGGTGNADGYVGEIVFFHVLIKNQKLNFVLKSEKTQEYLKILGTDILNQRELDIYSKVVPALDEFTASKNFTDLPTFIPKVCFADKHFNRVNIVLENLKLQNCRVLERSQSLDFSHMSVLFETYGKWHGISMAFRDQHRKKFDKLVESWSADPRKKLFESLGFVKQTRKELAVIQKMLIQRGRFDMVKIYEGVEDRIEEVLYRRYVDKMDMMIISHGDNWITNYMFKYKENTDSLTQIYLIDFQLSKVDSPASDLSAAFYNMGDQKIFEKFEILLSIYHKSLSDTLQSLGSKADQLFTIDDLRRHWKNHGLFNVLIIFGYLRVRMCDSNEAPDLGKMAENGLDFDGAFGFQMKNMETFWERALDVFIHYGEFLEQNST